jgi:hypothetical protein
MKNLQTIFWIILIIVVAALAGGYWYFFQNTTEDSTQTVSQVEESSSSIATLGQVETEEDSRDITRFDNFFLSDQETGMEVNIEVREDGFRYITANGIPGHETGDFPNDSNPNSISQQEVDLRLTTTPEKGQTKVDVETFGVTFQGIVFEPNATEQDAETGWQIEALSGAIDLGIDNSNAGVKPSGRYHYYGIPEELVREDSIDSHSSFVGWASDGFPIYARYGYSNPEDETSGIIELRSSWQLKSGSREAEGGPGGNYDGSFTRDFEYVTGSGDLDECNGRTTVTPEFPDGTYAYFLTDQFPYVPRCVFGIPDPSFD